MQDKTEEIENIEWTVTGKVKKIERYAFSEKPDLAFDYDPMGQRITKTVYPKSAPGMINTEGITKTYYVRDAQGNVMSIYTLKTEDSEKNLYLSERMLYGSTRLGMEQVNQIVASTEPTNIDINTAQQRVVGDKRYELSNHLGNVLATISDRKLPEFDLGEGLAYYKPDVVSYSDYMPFGMQMAERNGSAGDYRYGYQGSEKDDEIKGSGNSYTTHFRQLDPRIGRWLSLDPKMSAWENPYASMGNNPIFHNDVYGDTVARFNSNGSFKEFFDDGKTDWTWEIGSNDGSNWVSSNTGKFNDPSVDVTAIKNFVNSDGAVGIGYIAIMGDDLVEKQIDRSGVKDFEGSYADALKYAKEEGAKSMDYGVKGVLSGDLNPKSFYVREGTAYNVGDIGNYLWGRGMAELGIMIGEAKMGAHYNNIMNGRDQKTPLYDFGPGTYGDPGFWDSPGDQRAIDNGYRNSSAGKANLARRKKQIEDGKKMYQEQKHKSVIGPLKW